MKKLILSSAAFVTLLFSSQLKAQDIKSSSVPEKVSKALISKYPAVKKVSWEKEKGNYEANWGGKSGEDMSVQFSPEGVFIEQVEAIAVSSLPAAVNSYVKTHYKGAKIKEAGKVIDAKGTKMYEAELKGKDLIFDENGNFLKID